jgi:CSLREA domain-containing protein
MRTKATLTLQIVLLVAILAGLLGLPVHAEAATLVVNTTDDTDDGTCDATHCSLREAINAANAVPGPDLIEFNIPGPGIKEIFPSSTLVLMDDGTTVDATSQPGYYGTPVVVLNGHLMPDTYAYCAGLEVMGAYDVVRGMGFLEWDCSGYVGGAILVRGEHNRIEDNHVGPNPSVHGEANYQGLMVWYGEYNVIEGNVISNNQIGIGDIGGLGNTYQGNLIGTDVTGTVTAGNYMGMYFDGSREPQIGGDAPGEGNVISGNDIGVYFERRDAGPGYSHASVAGNLIGTDATGSTAVPNGVGVWIYGLMGIEIHGNVISGNLGQGIAVFTPGNRIYGNRIGTTPDGNAALGNEIGIDLFEGADRNVIGGPEPSEANVISGNRWNGIVVASVGNVIQGNKIGTNASGDAAVPNGVYGIGIDGPDNQVISNLVSGNLGGGIALGTGGPRNRIVGNRIGTDASGRAAIPNRVGLVILSGYNTVGGDADEERNEILYNESPGLYLAPQAESNLIAGNVIASNGHAGVILLWGGGGEVRLNQIRRNQIYDNGGLGIEIDPGLNDDIPMPVLTSATTTRVEGSACPGCLVEVFLAAPDPSNYGEGREFLAEDVAGADGAFTARPVGVDRCDPITATATDASGNTSEFSANVLAECTGVPRSLAVGGTLVLVLVGVAAGLGIGRVRGLRLVPASLVGGVVGGLVGVGLLGLTVALSMVRLEAPAFPSLPSGPEAPLPCEQFLDTSGFSPANGAFFEPGTDVVIELSPQPDPPGVQTRWQLVVTGPGQEEQRRYVDGGGLRLSELGFDPTTPGTYLWRADAERLKNGQWAPFCQGLSERIFALGPSLAFGEPAEPTAQPATPTATATPTPTSAPPMARLLTNANCRRDQGTVYDVVTSILQGQTVPINARNAEGTWWRVLPQGLLTGCWVSGSTVEVMGDVTGVPLIAAGPTPTPEQACWVQACGQCPLVCTLPCPPNATPGGACTP